MRFLCGMVHRPTICRPMFIHIGSVDPSTKGVKTAVLSLASPFCTRIDNSIVASSPRPRRHPPVLRFVITGAPGFLFFPPSMPSVVYVQNDPSEPPTITAFAVLSPTSS
ncbi:unnamed protein product [Ectocarpus sp. 8 AP-2014]